MRKRSSKPKNLKLPDWTKRLPDNARLTSKELSVIIGYKAPNSINKGIIDGKVFKPDSCNKYKDGRVKSNYWSMGYLRQIQKDQESE